MLIDDAPPFRAALLRWYDAYRRDLPWRRTRDPYAIWISEIMLQQTRVAAVIDHYQRFLRKFPTVLALSLAAEEEVLTLWSGLGYYRRARLLHYAARVVVAEHGGAIPRDIASLRKMPGVGVYTAAAIGSIAHGLPVAAVDGNVERVLARIEGAEAQRGAVKWERLAQQLLDPDRPGDHNQAMMELGATICTPRAPHCAICPVFRWCRTQGEHGVLPRPKMRSLEIAFALREREVAGQHQVLLVRRPQDASIMPGMWELPHLENTPPGEEPAWIARHSITTTNYYVRIYRFEEHRALPRLVESEATWTAHPDIPSIPLTGLARKILRRAGVLKLDTTPRRRPGYGERELEF